MTLKASEISETITKEAAHKYGTKNLIEEIQSYRPEVYNGIVEYFKAQNEPHPHLEAYEIYLLVEENLNSDNPSNDEILKAIESLLNFGAPE
jgi:hypothetical protein